MSFESIPSDFADAVGITEATAQVILSIAVIFTLLLPTLYLARGKNATVIYIMVFLLAEALLVGLTWLPFWVLIATVAAIAIPIAIFGSDIVTGEG